MRRLTVFATAVVVVTATLTVGGEVNDAAANSCPTVGTAGEVPLFSLPEGTDVEECGLLGEDLVVGDLALAIPEPGAQLMMESYFADGGQSFTVAVDEGGEISYPEPEDAVSGGEGSAAGSPSACSDSAYTDKDEEQAGRWQWYLGDGARTAHMTTAEIAAAFQQTLNWLSTGYNDCGIRAGYSTYAVSAIYLGVSELESDFHLEGGSHKCGDESANGRDGKSVVDFGNLDNNGNPPLASECTWSFPQAFNDNNIVESDIRFNIADFNFYNDKPANCFSRPGNPRDLRGVAMHEFGHTYGMGHVSESGHGNLTMSTALGRCDDSQRTLGKGDLRSLANTYGD